MRVSEWLIRYAGHPLWLAYKGQTGISSWQHQFEKLWTATPERLEAWRLDRLRGLLHHAATTSVYYRQSFEAHGFEHQDIRDASDLQQLPFLTKEILNERMTDILSSSYSRDGLTESSTGGSSGVPLTFYRDATVTKVRRAQDYFFNAAIGIYPGVKRAWVWGSPVDAFSLDKLKARVANYLTERAIYFYSFDATRERIREFAQQLSTHKPAVIFAYPNMLAEMARTIRDLSIKLPEVAKVVATAEPLYEWHRKLFREVFGAETYERYGSREIGTVASEFTSGDGMVICEPSYIIEVVDESDNQVAPGEMGELIVTDLFNKAMPLIRYRTGDMVRIAKADTDSNTCWRRIVQIGGRVVDMIQRADGSWVAGQSMIMSLRTAGIRNKVQVVQESPTQFRIVHLQGETLSEDALSKFKSKVAEIVLGEIEVTLDPVAELPHDKSGKYRYVTSQCRRAGEIKTDIGHS